MWVCPKRGTKRFRISIFAFRPETGRDVSVFRQWCQRFCGLSPRRSPNRSGQGRGREPQFPGWLLLRTIANPCAVSWIMRSALGKARSWRTCLFQILRIRISNSASLSKALTQDAKRASAERLSAIKFRYVGKTCATRATPRRLITYPSKTAVKNTKEFLRNLSSRINGVIEQGLCQSYLLILPAIQEFASVVFDSAHGFISASADGRAGGKECRSLYKTQMQARATTVQTGSSPVPHFFDLLHSTRPFNE